MSYISDKILGPFLGPFRWQSSVLIPDFLHDLRLRHNNDAYDDDSDDFFYNDGKKQTLGPKVGFEIKKKGKSSGFHQKDIKHDKTTPLRIINGSKRQHTSL